jgi:hypothetical protein
LRAFPVFRQVQERARELERLLPGGFAGLRQLVKQRHLFGACKRSFANHVSGAEEIRGVEPVRRSAGCAQCCVKECMVVGMTVGFRSVYSPSAATAGIRGIIAASAGMACDASAARLRNSAS